MAERCLELLALPASSSDPSLPQPSLLLDIGCGSGLSGEIIDEAGHQWVGCDISASMLGASYQLPLV
jgi:18S rRNA (guanine1575-N7)-methyltransferase